MEEELLAILKKYWGYDNFRAGQLQIIKSVIKNPATLAVLATGGGKSLCYQVPGLFLGGTTLVISPLISLMQDQVERLEMLGITAAVYNSTLTRQKKQEVEEKLFSGKLKFLYLAPESLQNLRLQKLLSQITVSLVAIDEAHCISIWGHDFRPAYLRIRSCLNSCGLRKVKLAAFTATATIAVREDILKQLHCELAPVFINSFARTNIQIKAVQALSAAGISALVNSRLKASVVLVYCSSRQRCDELAATYEQQGLQAAAYHGGLAKEQRELIQQDFINDNLHVLFATNAFGMGVDKPNLYTVIHDHIPDSIENYYQEAGRAGRDGQPSISIVNLNWGGINLRTQMLENNFVSKDLANRIYNYLVKHEVTGLRVKMALVKILTDIEGINRPLLIKFLILAQQGNILEYKLVDNAFIYKLRQPNILILSRWLDFQKQKRLYQSGKDKLLQVISLFSRRHCRQKFILNYFGESSGMCGNCDYCRGEDLPVTLN